MMFGDNESVVNTASAPHAKLHKRHQALSYHRTREAIAAGFLVFYHIRGTTNPADVLSKHWDAPSVWPQLRTLMFWQWDRDGRPTSSDPSPVGVKDGNKGSDNVLIPT
jgi:hypothetical protein